GGSGWGWVRGRAGELTRTVVAGPGCLLDLVELAAPEPRELVLPWHFQGTPVLESAGEWEPAEFDHPFLEEVRRDRARAAGPRVLEVRRKDAGSSLRIWLLAPGAELLLARGPGLPSESELVPFVALRARTGSCRWITLLDLEPSDSSRAVTGLAADSDTITVTTRSGPVHYRLTDLEAEVSGPGSRVRLTGIRSRPAPARRLFEPRPEPEATAFAPRIEAAPALDGTLDGFDTEAPLVLDSESQYRRSEEPYDPERLAAEAWVNWDGDALYLAVAVRKPELVIRDPGCQPLGLDNEPEDVNADGLQVYLRHEEWRFGLLVNPAPAPAGALYARTIVCESSGFDGRWARTPDGYLITLALTLPWLGKCWSGTRLGFDLLVNEMRPGRVRRAGQLVWSGGDGWIYLRGDRHDPAAFGVLELG
ncbi:MAG TPA: hypothetical protein VI383_01605, partial [Gemmatimonadales bacterium]|nr:hypothetical protein [Gemmatimonadales bacterium]